MISTSISPRIARGMTEQLRRAKERVNPVPDGSQRAKLDNQRAKALYDSVMIKIGQKTQWVKGERLDLSSFNDGKVQMYASEWDGQISIYMTAKPGQQRLYSQGLTVAQLSPFGWQLSTVDFSDWINWGQRAKREVKA